jgi:thioesterase domain-containing protein
LQSRILDQEEGYYTLEALATAYIKDIQTIQPEGPYLLGGFSFGGKVVFEMAQQLWRAGEEVALLALIDATAPGGHRRLSRSEQLSKHWRNLLTEGPAYILEKLRRQLYFRSFQWQQRTRSKKMYQAEQSRKPTDLALRLKRIEAAHKQTLKNYHFCDYYGKITLFRSQSKADNVGDLWDETLGWQSLAKGGLEIHDIPGNHNTIFHEPNVKVFAATLNACINNALSVDSTPIVPESSGQT